MMARIKENSLLVTLGAWWLLFMLLSAFKFNFLGIATAVSFSALLFVPGMLTLIILQIKGLETWGYVTLAGAFSIAELMIIGLIGNAVLPLMGIARPLDYQYILWELSGFVFILIIAIFLLKRFGKIIIPLQRSIFFQSSRDAWYAFLPIILVAMSAVGSLRLNNYAGNGFILSMLFLTVVYIIILFRKADTFTGSVLPTALFLLALSLLLMTSLRGWYITGHDIQVEYKVFEFAKTFGVWKMKNYQDPYNACMSITILPTILSDFLKVPDLYIYKIFFQIIFAFCAAIVYLISRNWLSSKMSLLAGIYFISFPTFFEDMPFLNRQEIAFLFYGLMIYIFFHRNMSIAMRRILFFIMGVGVVLSHYSTTYTTLAVFALAIIVSPVFYFLAGKYYKRASSKGFGLGIFWKNKTMNILLYMVIGLLAANFLWTTVFTNTASNVTSVARQTIQALGSGFSQGNRSIDALSFVTFAKPDQKQELADYLKNIVSPIRDSAAPGIYYDQQKTSDYVFLPAPDEVLPLTKLGSAINRLVPHADVAVQFLGQLIAKLSELAVVLGVIYVFFYGSFVKRMDVEYYLLALSCLFFIGLNVVLPVLSTQYGVFRAVQQSMFILAPFVVIGTVAIGTLLAKLIGLIRKHNFSSSEFKTATSIIQNRTALVLAVGFFAYSTAFVPQLFGNNIPQLHLSNTGNYYDNYLLQESEVSGIGWLTTKLDDYSQKYNQPQWDVQADRFSKGKIIATTDVSISGDIFPGIIRKQSYVFLSSANVNKGRSSVVYNGDPISYVYPTQFLDETKNLIYNDGGSRIYK